MPEASERPLFVFGCSSCGRTVSGSEERCPRCGQEFADDVLFECPFCGELIGVRAVSCPACRTRFAALAEAREASDTALESVTEAMLEEGRPTEEQLNKPYVCPSCDAPLAGTEAACPNCEIPLEALEAFECPKCGGPVRPDDDECPECGARFEPPA